MGAEETATSAPVTLGTERLYFIVETKGGLFAGDLREKESAKIECGRAHFKGLTVRENPASYEVARTVGDLLAL